MSTNGEFLAVDDARLAAVGDDVDALDALIQESVDAPSAHVLDIGGRWHLLQQLSDGELDVPTLVGEDVHEGVGYSQMCGTVSQDEVKTLARRLGEIVGDPSTLDDALDAVDYDDLYHGEMYAEDKDATRKTFAAIAAFFTGAASRGDAVVFRIL